MKKIIIIGIVMILVILISGCGSESSVSIGGKEGFCHDRNMRYGSSYNDLSGESGFYCKISDEYYEIVSKQDYCKFPENPICYVA